MSNSEPTARSILSEATVKADPIEQFRIWYAEAERSGVEEPEAMTLATATRDGKPSARVMLLRGLDERGFVFYTNYASRKGRALDENPRAALEFFWPRLERQVRIEGRVERVSAAESDAYFQSRPHGNRLGAWASQQSQVIAGREVLDRRVQELRTQYGDGPVPRPPHWGGYRVVPDALEFWQGQENRLHDRIEYVKRKDGSWLIRRLSP